MTDKRKAPADGGTSAGAKAESADQSVISVYLYCIITVPILTRREEIFL